MGLFDLFLSKETYIATTLPSRRNIPDIDGKKERRESSRAIERTLKNVGLEKIGKALEVVNNVGDSLENVNEATSILRFFKRKMSVDEAKHILKKGDHVSVHRSVYSRHGICDGDGWIYEYNEGSIRINSLEDFADGSDIYRVEYDAVYTKDEIVDRAKSRLFEEDYNVVINNCEHFAVWCRLGEKSE